jgi:RNA polymerase primary sigma factor
VTAENENKSADKDAPADSKYLRIYRKELRELPEYTQEEVEILYERLRNGENEVRHAVVESHLSRVVTLAGRYKGRGVPLEDLIQEGNLELMTCVATLCGNRIVSDFKKAIDYAVRSRLIELVDEELAGSDKESSVLARVNLLLEATRTLAEEYGRLATIEELSEFTHMDISEIEMYVELSRDKIELGKGGSV